MARIRERMWGGVAIDQLSAYQVSQMSVGPRDHHLLAINLADHPYVRAQRCGRIFEGAGRTGEAAIVPAGEPSTWDGRIPPHITVRIPGTLFVDIASKLYPGSPARGALANNFRLRDPLVANMAAIFSMEIGRASHPAQNVLMESLVTALLAHLLRGYAGRSRRAEEEVKFAGPAALRRALTYIDDQPTARIALDDLAAVAGLSRFHFSRVFRVHVGMSPAAYVERSRLDQAKAMMRTGQLPLADIAYAVGFSDQSHFARRFRAWEGCTPTEYLRENAWRKAPRRRR